MNTVYRVCISSYYSEIDFYLTDKNILISSFIDKFNDKSIIVMENSLNCFAEGSFTFCMT